MRPNLRAGLLLSNHHPTVKDEVALTTIIEAMESTADELPGEVGIGIYTPANDVWLCTLHRGVWELQKQPDGSWSAAKIRP